MRLIAIGDIHGQLDKLNHLLAQIGPNDQDQFVFLGDYVDRGPESKGVIQLLIDFKMTYPKTVFIKGNHDQMFINVLQSCGLINDSRFHQISNIWERKKKKRAEVRIFKQSGGEKTLQSYHIKLFQKEAGFNLVGSIPPEHVDFLEKPNLYYEQGRYIFVHAGMDPHLPLDQQDPEVLMWDRSLTGGPAGKTLVIGHTPTVEGEPLIADDLIMMDTGAGCGGPLTAMDLLTGQVWQAS